MLNNNIDISKVANGWIVSIPVDLQVHARPQGFNNKEFTREMITMVRQMRAESEGDPVLRKIREQHEEPEQTVPEVQLASPPVGSNPSVFVFPDFGQVLAFLKEKFSDA